MPRRVRYFHLADFFQPPRFRAPQSPRRRIFENSGGAVHVGGPDCPAGLRRFLSTFGDFFTRPAPSPSRSRAIESAAGSAALCAKQPGPRCRKLDVLVAEAPP